MFSHYDLYFLGSLTITNINVTEAAKVFTLPPTLRCNGFFYDIKAEAQIPKQFIYAIYLPVSMVVVLLLCTFILVLLKCYNKDYLSYLAVLK
ncbi:MAG: hypothetical protein ACTS73_08230 [Arsenophonus sp. NEOnobi-MAG3]